MHRKNIFRFKKFEVRHEQSSMKVGTDGVLLGAWTKVSPDVNILDVGTGSGVVALMLAQRTLTANIDAIDIDKLSVAEAESNFKSSGWSARLKSIHLSLQEYVDSTSTMYDLIVSNPPFFQNSLRDPDSQRSHARHTDELPFVDLLKGCKKLLLPGGKLSLILPVEGAEQFCQIAVKNGFYLTRLTEVFSNPLKKCHRWLMEFSNIEFPLIKDKLTLENEERGNYTEEYRHLTSEFYLNF
ncbi:MAG: methyltransferase [Bacteroidota bacterium]|nr:methyltransferase [Bacteroidota bacterium]